MLHQQERQPRRCGRECELVSVPSNEVILHQLIKRLEQYKPGQLPLLSAVNVRYMSPQNTSAGKDGGAKGIHQTLHQRILDSV